MKGPQRRAGRDNPSKFTLTSQFASNSNKVSRNQAIKMKITAEHSSSQPRRRPSKPMWRHANSRPEPHGLTKRRKSANPTVSRLGNQGATNTHEPLKGKTNATDQLKARQGSIQPPTLFRNQPTPTGKSAATKNLNRSMSKTRQDLRQLLTEPLRSSNGGSLTIIFLKTNIIGPRCPLHDPIIQTPNSGGRKRPVIDVSTGQPRRVRSRESLNTHPASPSPQSHHQGPHGVPLWHRRTLKRHRMNSRLKADPTLNSTPNSF